MILRGALDSSILETAKSQFEDIAVGRRLFEVSGLLAVPAVSTWLSQTVFALCGTEAKPVRVIYFDKSVNNNWSLGWHQDRTVAVRRRHDANGYDRWSRKGGAVHVEPPFDLLEQSITVRVSIDGSNGNNGALEVVAGSHRLGRLNNSETQKIVEEGSRRLLETEAGDVIFLSTPILHRSSASRTNERRRVVQIDYSWATLPAPLEWAFES